MRKITAVIKELLKTIWLNSLPYDINCGECEDFAMAVIEQIPEAEEQCSEIFAEFGVLPGHMWVEFRGKHYDAECSEGVENWQDLPIFVNLNWKELDEYLRDFKGY